MSIGLLIVISIFWFSADFRFNQKVLRSVHDLLNLNLNALKLELKFFGRP